MTAKQLKALSHLPSVIDALSALANESQQVQQLMRMVGMGGAPAPVVAPQQSLQFPVVVPPEAVDTYGMPRTTYAPTAPGAPTLKTPERLEYEAEKQAKIDERQAALAQKKLERAAFLRTLKGGRNGLLEQFAPQAEGEKVAETVREEGLDNMTEATNG